MYFKVFYRKVNILNVSFLNTTKAIITTEINSPFDLVNMKFGFVHTNILQAKLICNVILVFRSQRYWLVCNPLSNCKVTLLYNSIKLKLNGFLNLMERLSILEKFEILLFVKLYEHFLLKLMITMLILLQHYV